MTENNWVVDTSSILEIRRSERTRRPSAFAKLDELVDQGFLVFPSQVFEELKRNHKKEWTEDLPLEWAKKNKKEGTRHGPPFDEIAQVMADPQLQKVVDPDKVHGDVADPWVLALALKLKSEGVDVTVLSEDRRDRLSKLSVASACGLLKVYCLPIKPFLIQQGAWPV